MDSKPYERSIDMWTNLNVESENKARKISQTVMRARIVTLNGFANLRAGLTLKHWEMSAHHHGKGLAGIGLSPAVPN